MSSLKRICTIFIGLAIFFYTYAPHAQEQVQEKPWSGTLKDGAKINAESLKRILIDHQRWLDTNGKEGKMANLKEANLRGANLEQANLEKANLEKANLKGACLQYADLFETNLWGAKLEGASLGGAFLNNADLEGANLEKADMWAEVEPVYLQSAILKRAKLQGVNLRGGHLEGVHLIEAELQGADLGGAHLHKAHLDKANFQGADLRKANFQEASLVEAVFQDSLLYEAKLQGANMREANLQDAKLQGANLEGAIYEVKLNRLPNIPSIAQAVNLSLLTYSKLPHALVELREAFKKSGLRRQEREITYAIKHSGFVNAKKERNLFSKVEVYLGWFFFELTCKWGMAPERPMFILAGLIVVFSLFYMVSLMLKKKKDGIWKIWMSERVRTDLPFRKKDYRPTWRIKRSETGPPELLFCKTIFSVLGYGIYFSIISAFHVGWRELNVGNWIARIQPREYTLRASGWVRVVSGIQSLISVYLFALTILTYFGRPFESY